jgi:hypothetical protein
MAAALAVGPTALVSLVDAVVGIPAHWRGYLYGALYWWLVIAAIASLASMSEGQGPRRGEYRYPLLSWVGTIAVLAGAAWLARTSQRLL